MPQAHAISLLMVTAEPIVGYEKVQRIYPTKHTSEHMLYGVRATAGLMLFSLEGEWTRSRDTEVFPNLGLTTKDVDDKLKAGLRSTIHLLGILYGHARAGGQATKNVHQDIVGGVVTDTSTKMTIRPYAGAGISGRLGHYFEIEGDVTVVFRTPGNLKDNDYQATLGWVIRFP